MNKFLIILSALVSVCLVSCSASDQDDYDELVQEYGKACYGYNSFKVDWDNACQGNYQGNVLDLYLNLSSASDKRDSLNQALKHYK